MRERIGYPGSCHFVQYNLGNDIINLAGIGALLLVHMCWRCKVSLFSTQCETYMCLRAFIHCKTHGASGIRSFRFASLMAFNNFTNIATLKLASHRSLR